VRIVAVDKSMGVLVVDDYESVARIVSNLMEQLGFTNVDAVADGAAALEMIRAKSYGLVLSDWSMAPMSGVDLLKAVRADQKTKAVPFVMVSAQNRLENVIAARQAGADNYIVKPFTLAVLKQKLSSVLGEL
jgi:two-component system chemotaxis response regulator CheY